MFLRLFFNQLSTKAKMLYLKKKGVLVGSRVKEGRTAYIYMLTNLFVEVVYKNDNTSESPEVLKTIPGLKKLNDYLENEFKGSF